jgi:hypothetical protein
MGKAGKPKLLPRFESKCGEATCPDECTGTGTSVRAIEYSELALPGQFYCEVISGLPGLILPQSDLTKWLVDLVVDSDDFPLIVILMVVVARECSESRSSMKLCTLI